MVEAVGEAVAGAADVAQVSGVVPKRPVQVVTASAPIVGIRYPIKWDKPAFKNSVPNAACP